MRASVAIGPEAVGGRLEHGERFHVGLLLRSVHAARAEWNGHVDARILRGLFDTSATRENDQVGQRDLFTAGLRGVEVALNFFQCL